MQKILLSLTGCMLLVAQPTVSYSQDLLETYAQAVESDPTFASARSQLLAGKENIPLAYSYILPTVDAVGTIAQSQKSIPGTSLEGNGILRDQGYTLNLSQPLFNMVAWFGIQQAEQLVDQAEMVFVASGQDLIQRVAAAYFGVLNAQDTLAFTRAEKTAFERQLEQTKQKYDVGLVAITDVNDAQANYDSAVASEIQADNALTSAREALRAITGQWPDELAPLTQDMPLKAPEPANDQAWVDAAMEHNPNLRASAAAMEASHQATNVEKAEYLPSLAVGGSYGRARLGTFNAPLTTYDPMWTVDLTVTMNLFNGGNTTASVRQAEYTYQAVKSDFERVQRQTLSDTRNAYRGVLTAISEVNASNQAVISGLASLESTQAAYDVGTRTSVDLLNSISQLYQRKQSYAQSRYNYILGQLQLQQAVGTLSYGDLEAINGMLEKEPVITVDEKLN